MRDQNASLCESNFPIFAPLSLSQAEAPLNYNLSGSSCASLESHIRVEFDEDSLKEHNDGIKDFVNDMKEMEDPMK